MRLGPAPAPGRFPQQGEELFSRGFFVLWLAMFVGNGGMAVVTPILPLAGSDLGATGAWLGLTISASALTQIPATILLGRLSDRFGRKSFIAAGLAINAAAAAGYTLADSVPELIAFRALSGLGMAFLYTTSFAYAGDLAPRGREGFYMGTFAMAQVLSFGTGPLLGGVILDAAGADGAFLTMLATTGCSALAIVALLPQAPKRSYSAVVAGSQLAIMLRSPRMLASLTYYAVWGVSIGAAFAFMSVFLRDHLGAAGLEIGLVLSARSFLGGALQSPAGRLADRYSRTALAAGGTAIIGSLMFGVAGAESYAVILLLFALLGVFDSVSFPAATALAVDEGRQLGMGSTMGVLQMSQFLGMLVGTVGGGGIVGAFGIRSAFVFAGAVTMAGALTVAWATSRPRPLAAPQPGVDME